MHTRGLEESTTDPNKGLNLFTWTKHSIANVCYFCSIILVLKNMTNLNTFLISANQDDCFDQHSVISAYKIDETFYWTWRLLEVQKLSKFSLSTVGAFVHECDDSREHRARVNPVRHLLEVLFCIGRCRHVALFISRPADDGAKFICENEMRPSETSMEKSRLSRWNVWC